VDHDVEAPWIPVLVVMLVGLLRLASDLYLASA
jgi:hypothetical protein